MSDPAGVHDVALRHWHLVLVLLVSNVVTKGYCIKPKCEIHAASLASLDEIEGAKFADVERLSTPDWWSD